MMTLPCDNKRLCVSAQGLRCFHLRGEKCLLNKKPDFPEKFFDEIPIKRGTAFLAVSKDEVFT